MEPLDRIDEIISSVEAARSVPMSSNCMIHRGELLSALEKLRTELPAQIRQAQQLLDERDQVLSGGEREVQRMVAEAAAERNRLISMHEITVGAEQEATRIVEAAQAEAQRLRDETEEYVDTSLTNFDQLLRRTLDTVQRGRNRMTAVAGLDGSFDPKPDDKPLPF